MDDITENIEVREAAARFIGFMVAGALLFLGLAIALA